MPLIPKNFIFVTSSSSSLHMPGSAGLLTPNGGDNAS